MGEAADYIMDQEMRGTFGDDAVDDFADDCRSGRHRGHSSRHQQAGAKSAIAPMRGDDEVGNPSHVRIGFGKHRNKRLSSIPPKYLRWLFSTDGIDEELKENIRAFAEIARIDLPSVAVRGNCEQAAGIGQTESSTSCKVRVSIPLPRGNQVDLWFRKRLLPEEQVWLDRLFSMAIETVFEEPLQESPKSPSEQPAGTSETGMPF